MGKVFNLTFLALGLMCMLQVFGFETGLDPVFQIFGIGVDNPGISNSQFFTQSLTILIGAGVGGIIIGFFTKAQSENFIINALTTGILFVTLISIFNTLLLYSFNSNFPEFVRVICFLILAPITAGSILALVEFFRGTD